VIVQACFVEFLATRSSPGAGIAEMEAVGSPLICTTGSI
jgi:hypothetical protein